MVSWMKKMVGLKKIMGLFKVENEYFRWKKNEFLKGVYIRIIHGGMDRTL